MKITKLLKTRQNGFTIVELMIATTVFSLVLLVALAGFLQIGRLFYKGVNITQTTDDGKQAISSIKNDIAFSTAGASQIKITPYTTTVGSTQLPRYWFCAGPNRYSFMRGTELDTNKENAEMTNSSTANNPSLWSNFGLLRDRLNNATACPNPYSLPSSLNGNSATELLGDNMRLSNLSVCPIYGTGAQPAGCPAYSPDIALKNMYTLNVRIAYGDDTQFNDPNSTAATCKSGVNYSTYCFWVNLRTTVRQGIQ